MKLPSKLEQSLIIPNRDVDVDKKLRLSSLFAYFQDIACEHAGIIGPDIDTLSQKYGVAWILMRMRVEIERLPSIYEKVTLSTWPVGANVLFDRDYSLADEDGNLIVKCASTWILMDLKKRELVKKRPFDFYTLDFPKNRVLEVKPSKVKLPGEPVFQFEKIVSFSDIDYNNHLNNAKYLNYVSDCIDTETYNKNNIKVIEVNYANEAKLGDNLTLYKDTSKKSENIIFVEGKSDELLLFTSKIEFCKK